MSTYHRWVSQAYDEALDEVLKDRSDSIRQAVKHNPRKGAFIDRLVREVKQTENSRRLIFLNEKKIKDAVSDFCKIHFELILKEIEYKFNEQIFKQEAEQANFKIDEETGMEMLDD